MFYVLRVKIEKKHTHDIYIYSKVHSNTPYMKYLPIVFTSWNGLMFMLRLSSLAYKTWDTCAYAYIASKDRA
jgi:hypothetical protein